MYNLKREIIGTFLFFAEQGSVVDGITVDVNAFPDVDPESNWNSLGCVSEFNVETDDEGEDEYCPAPTGGYIKETIPNIVADYLDFQVRDHSEPIWRMMMGLTAEAVDGVEQVPFSDTQREIFGWLKVQGRGRDGRDRIVMNVYGKITLNSSLQWSRNVTRPELRFQVLSSPIATLTPDGIGDLPIDPTA